MELHVSSELGAKLARSAARQGRNPDELAQEVLSRYFEQENRGAEAVKPGEEAPDRGEYLTREQVSQRLQQFLKP
jgi:predicted transcriptional regulator